MNDAPDVQHGRLLARNAAALAATAAAVLALFVYPTSRSSRAAVAPARSTSAVVPAPGDQVVTGPPVRTQYGPVQVRVRIRDGKIIDSKAIVYPKGYGLDDIVDARALPVLDKEVLEAQSAHIDTVTAATYTSQGYQRSLQAALDEAHLG